MANSISLKSMLDNKLLLDGGFSAPAWKVSILIGKRRRKLHAFKNMLIESLSNGVEGVNGALRVKGVFNFVLIFFGKREGLAAVPLERRNFDLSNKTKKLENKSNKRDSSNAIVGIRAYPSPSTMLGGFRKKSKENPPYFKGKGMGWGGTPAFSMSEVLEHSIEVELSKLDSVLVKRARTSAETEDIKGLGNLFIRMVVGVVWSLGVLAIRMIVGTERM